MINTYEKNLRELSSQLTTGYGYKILFNYINL